MSDIISIEEKLPTNKLLRADLTKYNIIIRLGEPGIPDECSIVIIYEDFYAISSLVHYTNHCDGFVKEVKSTCNNRSPYIWRIKFKVHKLTMHVIYKNNMSYFSKHTILSLKKEEVPALRNLFSRIEKLLLLR